MDRPSPLTIVFVIFNIVFGSIIGALIARVPEISTFGVPSFLWLVVGLFVFEMGAGFLLNAHPATLITMPWRALGLVLSFASCYATLSLMS